MHLTFSITVLCLIATYFTFGELKAISQSLEDRELNGQTENHAKRMSLLSNAFICIWNMCYSITFFVTALYFKVSIPNWCEWYRLCSLTSQFRLFAFLSYRLCSWAVCLFIRKHYSTMKYTWQEMNRDKLYSDSMAFSVSISLISNCNRHLHIHNGYLLSTDSP